MTIAINRQSQLEHRIPPPAVFLAVAVGMAGAAWFMPPSGLAGPATQVLAAVLFVLAGFIGPPAVLSFRRNATTIDPVNIDRASTLVTTGIYRWTRNPMYLSMATLLTSLAVFSALPALILGPVFFVWFITRYQIVPEERVMQLRFGAAYDDYRARVRRWL
jgi:protein-S-isoprenylcysteine O-methyltransferase Ste14